MNQGDYLEGIKTTVGKYYYKSFAEMSVGNIRNIDLAKLEQLFKKRQGNTSGKMQISIVLKKMTHDEYS